MDRQKVVKYDSGVEAVIAGQNTLEGQIGAVIGPIIGDKASKKELQAVWKAAEIAFAGKPDFMAFVQAYQANLNGLATKGDLATAFNTLSANVDHMKTYLADVSISSAEILALNTTPKVLVSSPGAGKYIEVKRVEFFLDFNSAGYTVPGDLSLEYSSGGQVMQVASAGLLDATSDKRWCAHHKDQHPVVPNDGIALKVLTGNPTVGDSPLKVRVDYRIVDVLV